MSSAYKNRQQLLTTCDVTIQNLDDEHFGSAIRNMQIMTEHKRTKNNRQKSMYGWSGFAIFCFILEKRKTNKEQFAYGSMSGCIVVSFE